MLILSFIGSNNSTKVFLISTSCTQQSNLATSVLLNLVVNAFTAFYYKNEVSSHFYSNIQDQCLCMTSLNLIISQLLCYLFPIIVSYFVLQDQRIKPNAKFSVFQSFGSKEISQVIVNIRKGFQCLSGTEFTGLKPVPTKYLF